jgi:predicted permease
MDHCRLHDHSEHVYFARFRTKGKPIRCSFWFPCWREWVSMSRVKTWLTLFATVLPVFGLMGAGFGLRRLQWLTREADQSLLRMCVNVLLPSLIFESVLGNAALLRPENLLLPPLVGVVTVLAGMAVAWLAARFTGLESDPERRTFVLTAGLQNYAYVPLPLCLLLFDPGTVGVLLVHNVGVEVMLWTVGIAVLSGGGWHGSWKRIWNPPLLALLLALLLNGLGQLFTPPWILLASGRVLLTAVHWLGQSAIPLALLLIGAVVADHLPELQGGRCVRVMALAAVVRLLVLPLFFILLARYLPCSTELRRVIIVEGAMSSAVLPIALTKHYGGDPRTALQVVLSTSLAGLVTIPLWIQWGGHLAGLW